jgi:antibiotic biosynthesis monooxygenase
MDIALYESEPAGHAGLLLRALRRDVRFQYVALADGGGYEVAYEEGAPDGSEGVTLINPFEVPEGSDEAFLAAWHAVREALSGARGYLGTRLHRSSQPADFRYVNQARWSSPLMVQRALSAVDAAVPFTSYPALYLPV